MSHAHHDHADPVFKGEHHDHHRCVADAMDRADAVCARNGGRLTELRRRVLEIVWEQHRPVGAYDIIEVMSRDRARIAPPTVYRALDFLVAQGLVHRIDRLNAFVGCPRPDEPHRAAFLLCRDCGEVAEVETTELDDLLHRIAARSDFQLEHRTIELTGLCAACRAKEAR